ncbi:hypothetical protein GIX45_11680 [Erwinia sp. CPCC 100877]|nr:hypothetical protein [Erwinia sp. CPCC 100877]
MLTVLVLIFIFGGSKAAEARTVNSLQSNEQMISSDEAMTSSTTSEATTQTQAAEASDKEPTSKELPADRAISLGNSSITGTYSYGTYGQVIPSITYSYSTLANISISDQPILIIQIPTEIASQINGSVTKQQDFLAVLTGTLTYPGTASQDLHSTTNGVSLAYSSTYNSVYVTFPTPGLLLIGAKWSIKLSFDVGALYKRGITVPPAANGSNYAIRGSISDTTTGLVGITIITGNTQAGTIALPSMTLGTYPVPRLTAPVLTAPLQHLQTNVNGNIQQTQDSNYTYTVQLTINRTDGTTTPIIIANVPVDSAGIFNAALGNPLEYGDTVSATLFARSKTTTDYIQSPASASQPVSWTINPVTSISAVGGSNQLSGTAVQSIAATYQVKLQINNGTTYTTTLNANGSFQFTGLPVFQGGETVRLWIQGVSNRTGLPLLVSSNFTQSIPYVTPQLALTQTLERKNAQGTWESATSAVTGQSVRVTLKVTLLNQALWQNQQLKAYLPTGLTQLGQATLVKTSSAGVNSTILGTQLLTDTNTNTQYWSYQNTLAVNNFSEANTSFTLQYTAVVADNMADQVLSFKSSADGTDGGGTKIATQNNSVSLSIKSGLLRFVQAPSKISFNNLAIPATTMTYNPSTVDSSLVIADGRVAKSQWQLYVRENQAMQSTTTTKRIEQAFVYRINGVDYSVNDVASKVYTYTSPNDENVVISWNQQNGLLLRLGPSVNLNVNEKYGAQLQWILSDTPL